MLKSLVDVANFLEREWLASFVTVDVEGKPHVVPVWFTYDDGKVHIQTDRRSVKVLNLKKNDNVAVAVYHGEEAVIIQGRGRVIDEKKDFVKLTQRHIDKYNRLFNIVSKTTGKQYIKLDEQGRDSMGIPLFDSNVRCVVEVTPKKIRFW